MTHLGEADGAKAPYGRTLASTLLGRFEDFVAPGIVDAAERGRQARAIGVFVGAGLTAALASPLSGLCGLGMHAVVLTTILAGACLAMAGYLAGTGRLDRVLGAASTLVAVAAGLLAASDGGIRSPLLPLLAVAPVEAVLAGRRGLAGFASGIACLVLAGVAAVQGLGFSADGGRGFDGTMMLGFGILYAGLQTFRLKRARSADRVARERVDAEAQLINDALADAVLRFAPDGRLRSASKAAAALFLGEPGALTADRLLSLMHVTDRVRYLKALSEVRSGAPVLEIDVKMQVQADGSRGFSDIFLRFLPVRGTEDRLLSILCLARDVTGERARTAELTRALALAQENSEAKTKFLAAISHELRTPLNAIIGFSDVLDQEFFGGFENPRQKEYVGLIRQSGGHLLAVVNGLLDVAKIEAGRYELQMEDFSLEESLLEAADVMRPEAERKGLSLEIRLGGCRGAQIVADRRACHQILLNLLSNAVKFTDKGIVTLAGELKNGTFAVSVADSGIGIAAGDVGRLGQPFTQLSSGPSRRYPGTGLGLSLAKGLSDLHHGSMEIASELGKGTEVTVRIPLDCAARIEDSKHSKENVVALNHARKKPDLNAQDRSTRRTA